MRSRYSEVMPGLSGLLNHSSLRRRLGERVGREADMSWMLVLIVGAERRCWQARTVIKIALRAETPGVAHRRRLRHFRTGNDDVIALDPRRGGFPLAIRARDLEAL